MNKKYVYDFKEGSKGMKGLLGGKGANLAEMTNIGLPVPQGFVVTTEACSEFYEQGEKLWEDLLTEIREHLENLEEEVNKKFSDKKNPLLISVRSGAAISMPDRKSTRLNSSHVSISYAVFCLKKKTEKT